MLYKFTGFVLLFASLLASCGTDDLTPQAHEISFRMSSNSNSAERSVFSSLEDAESVLISIQAMDGASTEYTLKKIDLYNLNGEFISEKISLMTGQYKLTEFLVLDGDNNITHLAPLEGSAQAQNVSNPLAIIFGVGATDSTSISVEVISSEYLNLKDFGYVGFNLSEIELFDFLLSVNEKGNSDDFLEAKLTISNEDYEFTQELQAIINNHVAIKDGYDAYHLKIEKEGYHVFEYSFTRDSLSHYANSALKIGLEKDITDEDFLAISALFNHTNGSGWDSRVGQSFTVGNSGGYISKIVTHALGGVDGDQLTDGIYAARIIIREYVNDVEIGMEHGLNGNVLATSFGEPTILNFEYGEYYPTTEFVFSDSLYLTPNTKYVMEFDISHVIGAYLSTINPYKDGKAFNIDGLNQEYERDFPFALYLKD